jgi:hypothetical protein
MNCLKKMAPNSQNRVARSRHFACAGGKNAAHTQMRGICIAEKADSHRRFSADN